LAIAAAEAITALGGPAEASPSGTTVRVTGVPYVSATVAGVGLLKREANRIRQMVQISCWCPFSEWRAQYEAAILSALGTSAGGAFFAFGDGLNPGCFVKFHNQTWRDQSQSDYGLYESHISYVVEIPIMESQPGYAVGAVLPSLTASPLSSPLTT
jgi:hypothetical protein